MRHTAIVVFLLVAALTGCGTPATAVILEIDLSAYEVRAEVNTVHLQLSDDEGIFNERSFSLAEGDVKPTIALVPGGMTPGDFILVAFFLLDDVLVAQSAATPVTVHFEEITTVRIQLERVVQGTPG